MKLAEFLKDYGEFIERYERLLWHPIFTVKKAKLVINGLTYRKINAWDSKGLISSFREKNDTGWRKFSIIDIAKLNIISDLRKMGFPRKRVRIVMEKLDCGKIGLWSPKKNRVLRLIRLGVGNFIIACLFGVKISLVIKEKEETFFLSETGARTFYLRSNNEFSPVIMLPFFSYVNKTANVMKKEMGVGKDSTVAELFKSMLPYQEKRISKWIRSRNYKEILFRKSESKEARIKPGSTKDREFSVKDILKAINGGDYYSIAITTNKGQKISIIRKEWVVN